MAIHLSFFVEVVDPDDPASQRWLKRFTELMETLPSKSTVERTTFVPRDVTIRELHEFLRLSGYERDLNTVTRRLWLHLARVCPGRRPAEFESVQTVEHMTLPLAALKLLTRGHFQGSKIKITTRQVLLEFIASLK